MNREDFSAWMKLDEHGTHQDQSTKKGTQKAEVYSKILIIFWSCRGQQTEYGFAQDQIRPFSITVNQVRNVHGHYPSFVGFVTGRKPKNIKISQLLGEPTSNTQPDRDVAARIVPVWCPFKQSCKNSGSHEETQRNQFDENHQPREYLCLWTTLNPNESNF